MDQRIRSLARQVRAHPGDAEVARRYRTQLERLSATEPESAGALVDELEGVLAAVMSAGEEVDLPDPTVRGLVRIGPGARPPALLPRLPAGERLRALWEADGTPLWIGSRRVLLERPDYGLEARSAETGAVLWWVPSVRQSIEASDDRRGAALPWAVAPWGAVELFASYEAEIEYRRIARRGGSSIREPTGRRRLEIEVALQVVAAEGGAWSDSVPEVVVERAPSGIPLCESELCLESWDDDLLELALDVTSPAFAVGWGPERDWAVFLVTAGGAVPAAVAPAGWTVSPDEPPFAWGSEPERGDACAGPASTRFRLAGGAIEQVTAAGALLARFPLPAGLGRPALLGADGEALVLAEAGDRPLVLALPWSGATLARRYADWPPAPYPALLPPGGGIARRRAAHVLLAGGRVFLRHGEGRLAAFGLDPR